MITKSDADSQSTRLLQVSRHLSLSFFFLLVVFLCFLKFGGRALLSLIIIKKNKVSFIITDLENELMVAREKG